MFIVVNNLCYQVFFKTWFLFLVLCHCCPSNPGWWGVWGWRNGYHINSILSALYKMIKICNYAGNEASQIALFRRQFYVSGTVWSSCFLIFLFHSSYLIPAVGTYVLLIDINTIDAASESIAVSMLRNTKQYRRKKRKKEPSIALAAALCCRSTMQHFNRT